MTPLEFFILCLVSVVALMGISQIPLVSDLVTASGYSSTEVFAGLSSILLIFYTVLAVFTMRT